MNRRKFLKRTALVAGGVAVAPLAIAEIEPFKNRPFRDVILLDDRFELIPSNEYSYSYGMFDMKKGTLERKMIFHNPTQMVKHVVSYDPASGACIVWKKSSDYKKATTTTTTSTTTTSTN